MSSAPLPSSGGITGEATPSCYGVCRALVTMRLSGASLVFPVMFFLWHAQHPSCILVKAFADRPPPGRLSESSFSTKQPPGNIEVVLLLHKMGGNLRGGAQFNRICAWETAVKRGKGGFPGPTSWDPMDEEALRLKAEALLSPEVCS